MRRTLCVLLACLASASAGCSAPARVGTVTGSPSWAHGLPVIAADRLPPQARRTLHLIDAGGPYPYPQDGAVFADYEGALPREPRGYYHEYTVPTPGSRDRGARRIVTGEHHETYYTDDHYRSFKAVTGG
ncbi:ribonuclease N [Streptomyces sp. RB6PN25]|uniref:Ribonuclease N n=1 Tax=Streptomyces humicola TaxID=2953240 RepID=A0ABT1PR34_9ACTN|nr:ribonuclease domain-containing protein [Streptomyces humicola]MCQ4080132.1 ribonuclease N [Streptomyces humicola]